MQIPVRLVKLCKIQEQVCVQRSMCVCVCVSRREKERRSLQACSQTLRGCSSPDKRGRDSPSVSVDSGLWKHTEQLRAACDKKSLFLWEGNLSWPSRCLNPLIHLFTYRLSYICRCCTWCHWTQVGIFEVLCYLQLWTGCLNHQLLLLWCEGCWQLSTSRAQQLCLAENFSLAVVLKWANLNPFPRLWRIYKYFSGIQWHSITRTTSCHM